MKWMKTTTTTTTTIIIIIIIVCTAILGELDTKGRQSSMKTHAICVCVYPL
jgi:hypothetical protein